ncbi:MAG TPA: hypothetical protein VJN42_11825 [Candidatus Acidoferrum sp.]|nr:hypothetical protein [Candidatus Acidoferrum sp.]
MSNGSVPITYRIRFEKDHANVKLTYDLNVPVGGPALIADFQATVEGQNLITEMLPGQTAFNGVRFHTLAKPDEDATVSFNMSTNQGWSAGDEASLRGEKEYDEADFSG